MSDIEVVDNCQVEWDKNRGVLYVHNKETGATILRICRLPPSEAVLATGHIDVTMGYGVTMPHSRGS